MSSQFSMSTSGSFNEFVQPSRLGAVNKGYDSATKPEAMTGANRELFRKVFSAETFVTWKQKSLASQLVKTDELVGAKEKHYPVLGQAIAKYHKPGELINPDSIEHAKRVVSLDDALVSATFISDIDAEMAMQTPIKEYTNECATSLSEAYDRNVFRAVAKAGLVSTWEEAKKVLQTTGGDILKSQENDSSIFNKTAPVELAATSLYATPACQLVDAITKAVTKFKKANIPTANLRCILPPDKYELLINASGSVDNMAWMNRDVGGSGTPQKVLTIAGASIYETNHVPQTDQTTDYSDNDPDNNVNESGHAYKYYKGDFSNVVGVVFAEDCVHSVTALGLETEVVREDLRLGDNVLAKMAVGHRIMYPEKAIAIVTPSSSQMQYSNVRSVLERLHGTPAANDDLLSPAKPKKQAKATKRAKAA
ncbi:hypothetical protein [Vibrio harveyi]|uniref:hypothetical protein n=1 Tax=Vibrio harveyi TaxID=669 RepID=UPI00165DEC03|nr:hypothetical protein [Vibrio harveyi]